MDKRTEELLIAWKTAGFVDCAKEWRAVEEHIDRMRDLLADCATELQAEVEQRYKPPGHEVHPAMMGRYARDMTPALNALEFLGMLPETERP